MLLSCVFFCLIRRHTSSTLTDTLWPYPPLVRSDLGLLRTRAVPRDDGSHAISGTKIFFTAGEHDFTDNIVHLVLARLPDAPADRSEEHTSELQSLMRISYAVFSLKKNN